MNDGAQGAARHWVSGREGRTWHWRLPAVSRPAEPRSSATDDLRHLHELAVFPAPERGTLLFLLDPATARILLIEKHRGHGAGLINGPGGKVESGETCLAGVLREVAEELHIEPLDARLVGELRFVDRAGASVWGWVYRAEHYLGTPTATIEATPFWCARDALPHERMWPGDRFWMRSLLAGVAFKATLLSHDDAVVEVLLTEYNGGAA